MKLNLKWQVLLAVLAIGLVVALVLLRQRPADVSGVVVSGVAPAADCGTPSPVSGGVFVEGMVGAPRFLNPLLSDPYPVDREIVDLLFDGLTRYDAEGNLVPALAESWSVSEDGRTVRFTLRPDAVWHDGEPVTAEDVAFTYSLMQDEAFPGLSGLKLLWQAVTIRQEDERTIVFELDEPYAPFLEATTRGILPAHHLEGVTAASLPEATINRQPVGTGPFMVAPDQDWQRTHRLRLLPNPDYWAGGTQIDAVEIRFYPDETSMLQALVDGELHGVNGISPVALPVAASIPDLRLFTSPAPRYSALLFNLTDSGFTGLQDVSVRQALAYGLDRDLLVDRVLNGQAVPLEGPYLPVSWAYNPVLLTPYATNLISATTRLDEAGWILPEGQTVRQQDETLFQVRLLALNQPTAQAVAAEIGRQWGEIGVAVLVETADSLTEFRQMLAERAFDVALVDIAPPVDPDLYDFWSQEAIVRGQNYAGWNHQRASEALEKGRQVWDVAERRPFYDTFLRFYMRELPALTLYQQVYTYGMSNSVHNAEIGLVVRPRDRFATFADWFLLFREATTDCE